MIYDDIKNKRKKYKISQTKLAEASGFSKSTISKWELKKETPNQDELSKVNFALEKMVYDIENSINDVRKKRIVKSKKKKRNLPKIIKTADEYKQHMECIKKTHNDYNDILNKLYDNAQKHIDEEHAPKAIALFSGCGGLSYGFKAQGFNLVGHVEIEPSANKIYEENFPDSDLLGTDICMIGNNELLEWKDKYGEIDIIIGGPPCQGFSLAGKRNPNDERNRLYRYYANVVSVIKPKIFIMENVRLLTSMKMPNGELFINQIIKDFSDVGYKVTQNYVNALNYGVPQSRERVIIVGVRNDIDETFIFPSIKFEDDDKIKRENLNLKRARTFKDATFDLETLESGENSSDPLHWTITHPDHVINWLKDVPEGHSAHENKNPELRPPSGFNTTYKRNILNKPCSTISTNFSMISGCRNVHPISTRSLTIREAARIQSFPDNFIFIGKWGDIRKAIGNAVPPLLANEIAKSIFDQYFQE